MALGLLFASGVALAESQLDQQQTSSNPGYSWSVDRWNWLAGQTFTAGVSGQLNKVSIYAGCCMNKDEVLAPGQPPGDLLVKIYAMDSTTGYPSDFVLGSGRAPSSSFTTNGTLAWVDVALDPAPGVVAGKQYALVVTSTGNGYDRWQWYAWGSTHSNAYAGGMMVVAMKSGGGSCPTLSGWNWGPVIQDDMAFRTYVEPGTPAPPVDTTSPNTCILGPSSLINDNTPTFTFGGVDDLTPRTNLLFSYKHGGDEWSAFSSERSVTLGGSSGLADGAYTFYLKARDEAGNEDATPIEKSFTVDATAPTVTSVKPANGATSVPRGTDVKVTFSEGMDPCSIDRPTFMLYKWNRDKGRWQQMTNIGLSTQPPLIGCSTTQTQTASLDPYPSDPTRLLARNTKYRAVLTIGVRDRAGNPIAEDYAWTFKTKGR